MTVILLGPGCLSNDWPPCLGEGTGYFRSNVTTLDPPGYVAPHNNNLPYIHAGEEIAVTVEPPECGGPPEEYIWELQGHYGFDREYTTQDEGRDGFNREYTTQDEDLRFTVPYVGRYILEPTFVNPDGERVLSGVGLDIRAKYRVESELAEEGFVTNFTTFCCPSRGVLNLTSEGVGPEAAWTARVLVDRTDELIAQETLYPESKALIARESHFLDALGEEWVESIRVEIERDGSLPPNPLREYEMTLEFDVGAEPITHGPD